MPELLALRDVTVARAGRPVLERVSLALAPGEALALTGPNGAGKSTLIRAIAGLERPAAGTILWQGEDVTRRPFHARDGIALVPEGRLLAPHLTVAETCALGAGRLPAREIAARTEAVLARFPALAPRRAQQAGTLSGGEAQMLSLARALMAAPRLLLLDEPTLGLAPAAAKALFATLRNLSQEGLALILTDQDSHASAGLAHRVLALHDRILFPSEPQEA